MSSRKNAIVTGSIFFVLRLVFFALVVMYFGTDWTGTLLAIAFGIGAFTDLFLVLGAWKKNIGAIYFWCFAQLIVGGIPCCIAIPLVAMKAVQEIKDGKESLLTTQFQCAQGIQYQKF